MPRNELISYIKPNRRQSHLSGKFHSHFRTGRENGGRLERKNKGREAVILKVVKMTSVVRMLYMGLLIVIWTLGKCKGITLID